jgi:hypothetical protein
MKHFEQILEQIQREQIDAAEQLWDLAIEECAKAVEHYKDYHCIFDLAEEMRKYKVKKQK